MAFDVGMMLGRLKAIPRSVLRTALDSRSGHLLRMAFRLRRLAHPLAILLALALLASLYLSGSLTVAVFTWLGGWRWPHLMLALPAAFLLGIVMMELYAAAILAVIGLVLRLGYDIGRARFGAILAIAAISAGVGAGLRLWSERAGPAASGPIAAAVVAGAMAAFTLWFARTYLRPAARGFRSFHVDLVEARRALEGARHGA